MNDGNAAVRWVVGTILLVAVAGGAVYLARRGEPPRPQPPAATSASPASTPTPSPSPIQHPIEDALTDPATAEEPEAPLPPLADSDTALLDALAALVDAELLDALLLPDYLIQRAVATIDNLPRKKLAPNVLPTRPVPGRFVVADDAGQIAIAADNAARYADHVRLIEALDAHRLVVLYVRLYPLFQQAYRELGNPDAYFNDRLIEVIDHLLAAPDAPPGARLVKPRAFYEFEDPALEALSAGHKLMIRIGPEHAARVKAKLREIRTELTGQRVAA
jgi:hypothetical protein